MISDRYIDTKLTEYGLRFIPMFQNKFDSDIYEFLFRVLNQKAFMGFQKEMEQFLIEDLGPVKEEKSESDTLTKTYKGRQRRRRRSYKRKDLEELLEDLHRYKYSVMDYEGELERFVDSRPRYYRKSLEILEKYLGKQLEKYQGKFSKSILYPRLLNLKKLFKLSEIEWEMLTLLYLVQADCGLRDTLRGEMDIENMARAIKFFCRTLKTDPHTIRKSLNRGGVLISAGLLERSRGVCVEVTDHLSAYLSGISDVNLVDQYWNCNYKREPIAIEDHIISQKDVEMVIKLLNSKKGVSILIHGEPGTGKTEFIRSLAKHIGRNVVFITQEDDDEEENINYRKSALVASQNFFAGKDDIVVVDECDVILNTRSAFWECEMGGGSRNNDSKAWINGFLEKARTKTIWISNYTLQVDDSTRRRFSYVVEFKKHGRKQRETIWHNIQEKHQELFNQKEVKALARDYEVNAGSISLAFSEVSNLKGRTGKEQKRNYIKNILASHQKFIQGDKPTEKGLTFAYDLSILNTDNSVEQIIESVSRFSKYLEAGGENPEIRNMNILLQGPPGTGKTEYARYLAQTLGKELMVKRASDILSKYVGESEKFIAQAFWEAEEQGAILLIDEVDSLLESREVAQYSWVVTQVNEFLTRMENFKGILMCATNFVDNLDSAAMRRFNHKVKFGYMTGESNLKLFKSVLLPLSDQCVSESDRQELLAMRNLTPGDFKVVYQRNIFTGKENLNELINQLKSEIQYKKDVVRKMGLR